MAKHLSMVSICSVMMIIALFTTALLFAQDQSDNFEATINIPIDLLNSLAVDEVGILTVYINCNAPSCAALDLNIEYDPSRLGIEGLNLSDHLLNSLNPIHILRREIDTTNGEILLTVVTQDADAPPMHGNFELIHLTVRRLSENSPQLDVQKLVVTTLDGKSVSTVFDTPSNSTAIVLSAETPITNSTVMLELSVIGLVGDMPIAHPQANVTILPDPHHNGAKKLSVQLPSNFDEMLIIDQKGYIGCSFTLEQPPQHPITLYPGDIDDNGMINDLDLDMWESLSKGAEINWAIDLNLDDKLDIRDIVIISRNIGLSQGVCL